MTPRAAGLVLAAVLLAGGGAVVARRGGERGAAGPDDPDAAAGPRAGLASGAKAPPAADPGSTPADAPREAAVDGTGTDAAVARVREVLRSFESAPFRDWMRLYVAVATDLCLRPRVESDALRFVREELVPVLLRGLSDAEPRMPGRTNRDGAIDVVGACSALQGVVTAGLLDAWHEASPALRAGILRALLRVDEASMPARVELRALVADDADLAAAALDALQRRPDDLGSEDVDAALRALDLPGHLVRSSALSLLASAPPSLRRRASDRIAALWDPPDPTVLREAVFALGVCDPDRARRMALERLSSSDVEVRAAVVWALGRQARNLSSAETDALLAMLSDAAPAVRGAAANALAFAPDLRTRSLPLLRERLEDEGWAAYNALGAIARLDPDGAVADLERALSSRQPLLRYLAVVRLSERDPAKYGLAILAAVSDDDRQVREAAARALALVPELPVDALVAALDRVPPEQRAALVQAIGAQGPRALSAAPALEKYASDPRLSAAVADALRLLRGR